MSLAGNYGPCVQMAKLLAASGALLGGQVSAELVGRAVLTVAQSSAYATRRRPQLMALMDDIKVTKYLICSLAYTCLSICGLCGHSVQRSFSDRQVRVAALLFFLRTLFSSNPMQVVGCSEL